MAHDPYIPAQPICGTGEASPQVGLRPQPLLRAGAPKVLVGCDKGKGKEPAYVEPLLSIRINSFHPHSVL